MKIDTVDAKPISLPPYRASPREHKTIEVQIFYDFIQDYNQDSHFNELVRLLKLLPDSLNIRDNQNSVDSRYEAFFFAFTTTPMPHLAYDTPITKNLSKSSQTILLATVISR
ncbi:uncharacterized protein VTP21DRAFT_9047 [Calcarisporiella thermophila]|uniref:uncharacterized protein n=1 Tax=Calcarisporiella thermophila TaxID=911321 RepID=UPI0037439FE4